MINVLFAISFMVGYENAELPVVKFSESNNSNVIYKEVITSRRFFPRRTTYVEYEVTELPVIKEVSVKNNEPEIVGIEVTKRQPVRNTISAIRNLISDVHILPRRGTIVRGNAGNPVVTEETTVTTITKVEEKEPFVRMPVEENSEEPNVIMYEDRRVFSGRVRNRVFHRGR